MSSDLSRQIVFVPINISTNTLSPNKTQNSQCLHPTAAFALFFLRCLWYFSFLLGFVLSQLDCRFLFIVVWTTADLCWAYESLWWKAEEMIGMNSIFSRDTNKSSASVLCGCNGANDSHQSQMARWIHTRFLSCGQITDIRDLGEFWFRPVKWIVFFCFPPSTVILVSLHAPLVFMLLVCLFVFWQCNITWIHTML